MIIEKKMNVKGNNIRKRSKRENDRKRIKDRIKKKTRENGIERPKQREILREREDKMKI